MKRRVLCLGLLLAACSGPSPTHYYTLAPIAPSGTPRPESGLIIDVGAVSLPPSLDRDSVVTSAGPEQLDVSSRNRWAAPLDGIVRRVLAADLATRLPGATVLAPGDPAPKGHVLTIDVNVRQFMGDAHGLVTLDADWTVHGSKDTRAVLLTHQAPSAKTEAIAAAMSVLLGELSDRIAADIPRGRT